MRDHNTQFQKSEEWDVDALLLEESQEAWNPTTSTEVRTRALAQEGQGSAGMNFDSDSRDQPSLLAGSCQRCAMCKDEHAKVCLSPAGHIEAALGVRLQGAGGKGGLNHPGGNAWGNCMACSCLRCCSECTWQASPHNPLSSTWPAAPWPSCCGQSPQSLGWRPCLCKCVGRVEKGWVLRALAIPAGMRHCTAANGRPRVHPITCWAQDDIISTRVLFKEVRDVVHLAVDQQVARLLRGIRAQILKRVHLFCLRHRFCTSACPAYSSAKATLCKRAKVRNSGAPPMAATVKIEDNCTWFDSAGDKTVERSVKGELHVWRSNLGCLSISLLTHFTDEPCT